MISVIIPVYNEEAMLRKHEQYYRSLSGTVDLIFSDGASSDQTAALAGQWGRIVQSSKNRAVQMNAAARVAKGEILLFLHADSIVSGSSLEKIAEIMQTKNYAGGCLTQILDERGLLFRWIAFTGNMRARIFRIFYGDQGMFVRKEVFEKLGGFPEVKICEDILFSKELRRAGKVGILPFPVYCSCRRWKKQGVLKTFMNNAGITAAIVLGIHPDTLKIAYEDVR